MSDKVISIVLATYNASETISTCLDSIEQAIRPACELIVIDGDSVDDTIDQIQLRKGLVDVLISEPDSGIYDAWNKGIEKSSGKWILFLGADDLLFKESLEKYLNLIATDNLGEFDYICGLNDYVDLNNNFIKSIGKKPEWSSMKYYMVAAHVASLHNRNIFQEVGFFDQEYKICGDYELLTRKGSKLSYKFLPIKIAKMRVGGMSFSLKALVELFDIRQRHLGIWANISTFIFQVSLFVLLKIKLYFRQ